MDDQEEDKNTHSLFIHIVDSEYFKDRQLLVYDNHSWVHTIIMAVTK